MCGLFSRLHVVDVAVASNPVFISVYPAMLRSQASGFLHFLKIKKKTINTWESRVEK